MLLSFHIGDEVMHPDQFLEQPISMDFYLFQPAVIVKQIEAASLAVTDVIERGPHAPEVEYQSRRAYICALKPQ